jgi:hypothetical protein
MQANKLVMFKKLTKKKKTISEEEASDHQPNKGPRTPPTFVFHAQYSLTKIKS